MEHKLLSIRYRLPGVTPEGKWNISLPTTDVATAERNLELRLAHGYEAEIIDYRATAFYRAWGDHARFGPAN